MIYTKSQKIQRAFQQYLQSTATRLEDVYGRFSVEKARAFGRVKNISDNMSGTQPHIITHNTFTFTAAFFGEFNGEVVFVYVTPNHIYYCNSADLK